MPLTRAQVDAELADRGGEWITLAGLTAPDAFDSPIAYGLRQLRLSPADPTAPADADLAGVLPDQEDRLLDSAEVRLLENCLAGLGKSLYDQKVGAAARSLGQVRASLEKLLARRWEMLRTRYGIGLGTITGGTIDLDFAEGFPEPLV